MPSAAAPRLVAPWRVVGVEFRDADAGGREPRITIGYGPGSRFHRPEVGCGEASRPAHDTMERTWRHLNFFRYKAFVHVSVPRVACPGRGVRAVGASGRRVLPFEAMAVELDKSQPVADVAARVGEHGTGPWRFIRRYADEARPYGGYAGVEAIGVDGTGRRGRRCIVCDRIKVFTVGTCS